MFVYTQDGLTESIMLGGQNKSESKSDPVEDFDLETYFQEEPYVNEEPYQAPPSARPRAYPSGSRPKLPTFSPEELIGEKFIYTLDDGQKVRAEVVCKIELIDAANHQNIKMLLKIGDSEAEDVIDYLAVCDLVEQEKAKEEGDMDQPWTFKEILAHKGLLTKHSPNWKHSKYNVQVLWDDGSTTWEPLNVICKDDPVTCAKYGQEHNLMDLPGWKFMPKEARRRRRVQLRANKAKSKGRRNNRYKFGVKIPRDFREARKFQEEAGHTKWTDAERVELDNLFEYETFKDLGPNATPPEGYQKINMIWVYDCKHDFRHKARMVAGGHLTKPVDDAYSSVVSLESMRLALAVGEINGLTPMVGDIGNAYLEAYTKEKVYFIAGPEFGDLEGHIMIIHKALYGLRTSGARFHERLADALRAENFTASLADPDLWLRDARDCYEYICVYVDDLCAIMKHPEAFFETLRTKYKFKLKGVGHPEYHLGGNFGRDPNGTLFWGAKTYVEKLLASYERIYDGPPAKFGCPMDPNDHPELDQSPLLSGDEIVIYQSLVGALQWAITPARFDIACAVASLLRFHAEP